ncbi:uncharacterized protein LOC125746798 isoform X2 [Brienomyrus brachyistius]|uniref:uncharacterized protein LOC125746798 isoform X2 n=1 Tax=Brienomyrus brachyistius TaxID=42636 RepID=UPI0020B3AAA2|nr:uncharacterized protein LOC125746798 isoform X2 [Brienomyrus brachyistius]
MLIAGTMAALVGRLSALRVMVLVSLLSQTAQFGFDEIEWDELRPDVALLHRLMGLPDRVVHQAPAHLKSSRMKRDVPTTSTAFFKDLWKCQNLTECVIQNEQNFRRFMKEIESSKIEDKLVLASQLSYTYQNKLILIMDQEMDILQRAQQEYSEDPHYSIKVDKTCIENYSCTPTAVSTTIVKIFGRTSDSGDTLSGYSGSALATQILRSKLVSAPVFSIDGNTSAVFQYNFMRIFKPNGITPVLEIANQNDHIYQVMDQSGKTTRLQVPKRPADHTTQYDWQNILIMEDDPTVRKMATFLYEKHPTVSSVYVLENQKPKLIKGDAVPLSQDSRLVLVGHGKRDGTEMKMGGYRSKEVAEIISHMNRDGDHIKTISMVACELGSDKVFISNLLKDLHARSIKTKLHLKRSLLQVGPSGKKITVEITPDGIVYRQKDHNMKVVAWLDKNEEVIIEVQSSERGEPIFPDEHNFLILGDEEHWPTHPRKFVQNDAREDHTTDLEALSWAFFHKKKNEDLINLLTHPTRRSEDKYLISAAKIKKDGKVFKQEDVREKDWLNSDKDINKVLDNCYEIKSSNDIMNIITHYTTFSKNDKTGSYLMLHDWIFQIAHGNIYVFPVGKRLSNNEKGVIKKENEIKNCIYEQSGKEQYKFMKSTITNFEDGKQLYAKYARETLQGTYIKGSNDHNMEAWFGTYFTASVISESSRNFRTFPAILMALDMSQNSDNNIREKGLKALFEEHPMAGGGTWISPEKRGFFGSSTVTGRYDKTSNLRKVTSAEENIYSSWSNNNEGEDKMIERLLQLVPLNDNGQSELVKQNFKDDFKKFKQEINQNQPHVLGGSDDGRVTSQDMQLASEVEHSLKLSSHYSRSSNLLSDRIESQWKGSFGETLGGLKVDSHSVRVEDGKFHCLLQYENYPRPLDYSVALPEEAQRHMETFQKNMRDVSEINSPDPTKIHKSPEHLERMGKIVGTVGLMLGMQGAVRAFETGDIKHGVMGTLQTTHGITQMALAALAKASVTSETKVMKVMKTLIKSRAGRFTMNVVMPLAGIGFGIYNVLEDLQRNDTLRNVDLGLDLLILDLDIIEYAQPELAPIIAPVNLALNIIRMGIDYIYISIQNELANLPQNAGTLLKIEAVFKGLIEGENYLTLDVLNFFYTIPYHEIEKGRRLVQNIADYHKYYSFHEVQGRKTIDFSSGNSSWNSGSITFCLAEEGSSEFCMENFVSSDEILGKKCWKIETKGTSDIVLGTGESHYLTYTEITLKMFLLIPVDQMSVVSGYKTLSDTRYGSYYGNDKENNFFAIQSSNDAYAMEVMLDYYYKLYGKKGGDSFYLGPQRSHVEGQGGRDIYIIPETGGNTHINNYAPDMATDLLILSVNYCDISVTKSGNDVILQYLTNHNVRILNWFLGEEYRHLNMMSADGVLFDIHPTVISSVKLIALGVNKMSKTQGQRVNALEPLLLSVTNIVGSPQNDWLIGNLQKNVIEGGGGTDHMKGGEGEDIYVVNENSVVYIENHSHDKETDMLITDTKLHDFRIKVQGNDLTLMAQNQKMLVTLVNWFRFDADRHLLVVAKDLVTFTISEDKAACRKSDLFESKCILSQVIDYSKSKISLEIDMQSDEALQSVTEVYGSDLDDTIKGNAKRNSIMPGQGNDFLQGLGEEDWYVVTPGHGLKTIDNYSPDTIVDTLFLRERYEFIFCICEEVHLSIYINYTKEVLLKGWFNSKQSQHLQIQSADGITFKLIDDLSQCGGRLMFPQSVDYRNRAIGQIMRMEDEEFATVVEMYGSSGLDFMVGNDNDNLLDPFTGGGQMMGKEGTDRYVVKPEYGMDLWIDNFALDEKVDTVLFKAEFLSGHFTVESEEHDILVSTTEKGQKMQVRLINYRNGRQNQHLSFQSHDGVSFRVRSPVRQNSEKAPTPWIEPYKVKLVEKQTDCRIDLSLHGSLSTVHTVQGCLNQSNHILGNRMDNALFGGMKDDALEGGPGHDTLIGGQGSDILMGNSGDDTLYGDEGNDTMLGGSGADVFVPGLGADLVDGGSGRDTVLYLGDHKKGEGVYVNLQTGECRQADAEGDVLKDIENVIGTIYSDVLISGSESTLLKGSDGDDILVSVNGDDYLVGGEGQDIYLLVSPNGLLTINNCADDNSTDILYLDFLSQDDAVGCSQTTSWLSLTFSGSDGSVVEVRLMEWHNSSDKCGHLTLILREGATSIDKLQICQHNDMFIYLVRAVAVATVAIAAVVHVIGILLSFLKCVRRNNEVIGQGRPVNNEGEAGLESSEDVSDP